MATKSKLTKARKDGKPGQPPKATKSAKGTKPAKAAGGGTAPENGMSGLDAAAKVLKDVGKPMKVKTIVETMLGKGYWKTGGKTPAATIYSSIIREIDVKKGQSRFKKTGRGLFAING